MYDGYKVGFNGRNAQGCMAHAYTSPPLVLRRISGLFTTSMQLTLDIEVSPDVPRCAIISSVPTLRGKLKPW